VHVDSDPVGLRYTEACTATSLPTLHSHLKPTDKLAA
jgi:hypothetical protein